LKRKIQVGIVSFIVGSLMVFSPTDAFAESVITTITCANEQGEERTFQVGWDNSHQFFDGRGEIPRLYCEGGYAGSYTTYISDGLPVDSPLRYYNGIVPSPTPVEPTPVPSETPQPEPTASIEPSLDPTPTPTPVPTPEPTQSESPSPEPTVEPSPTPTQTIAEPTPIPTPEVVVPVPVEPTPTPEVVQESVQVEPTPSPTPTIEEIVPEITPEPQPTMAVPAPVSDTEQFLAEVSIQLPTYLENVPGIVQLAAAAESIMAIGSDMTPEEREESQGVVVAAVIVGQLAQVRRLK
jgi:hypothetical protein